jgi:hypothetical protein
LRAGDDVVAGLQHALDDDGVDVTGSDVQKIERLARRLDAARLAALARIDAAGVAGRCGAAGTGAWLATVTRTDGAAAAGRVALARSLDAGLDRTREAMTEGALSVDHARVITTTLAELPGDVTADERDSIEAHLVEQARVLDPARLRQAARRALAVVARPDEQVDAHHGAQLRAEEDQARARTRLTLHDNADGTTTGHFTVPTLAASMLRTIVQQMTAPRRASDHTATDGEVDGRALGTDWAHAQGLAFASLLERLPTDHLPHKVAATVVVTLDHHRLVSGLGAAGVETGMEVSAGEARRLACSAGIVPAVLGTDSVPLDLGRSCRLFSTTQRLALAARYGTCAIGGCDRPFAWCEIHHLTPWSRGGRTDLANAVPACSYHHHRLDDPAFHHTITAEVRGRKTIHLHRRT